MAGHADAERGGGGRRLRPEHRAHGREGDQGQDDDGRHRPGQLELRVAPDLGGQGPGVALAEAEDDPHEHRRNHQEDPRVPPEDAEEDVIAHAAEVGLGGQGGRGDRDHVAGREGEAGDEECRGARGADAGATLTDRK